MQDGKDVYRRNLPHYARSQIAFLGAHFFALSLFEEGESFIEVLRFPDDLS